MDYYQRNNHHEGVFYITLRSAIFSDTDTVALT